MSIADLRHSALSVVIAFLVPHLSLVMPSGSCWAAKRNFATYELMGMEGKTVQSVLAENGMIVGAFLLGTLLGTGLLDWYNQVVRKHLCRVALRVLIFHSGMA